MVTTQTVPGGPLPGLPMGQQLLLPLACFGREQEGMGRAGRRLGLDWRPPFRVELLSLSSGVPQGVWIAMESP